MIQRIQSVYFLMASSFAFLTLQYSFYSGHLIALPTIYTSLSAKTTLPLIVLTVIVAVVSLITIFLFKDRSLQIKLTIVALIISIGNIVLYFLEKAKFISEQSSFDLTSVFTFLIPIFLILALRGIIKDRKLIRSVDRLR